MTSSCPPAFGGPRKRLAWDARQQEAHGDPKLRHLVTPQPPPPAPEMTLRMLFEGYDWGEVAPSCRLCFSLARSSSAPNGHRA